MQETIKTMLTTILDNIKMVKNMAKENLFGEMETFMKVDFKMATGLEMAHFPSRMETNMKENCQVVIIMDLENSLMVTLMNKGVIITLECSKMICIMEMASCFGRMVQAMKEPGKRGKSKAMAQCLTKKEA